MKPFGASLAWLALWPQLFTPRFSAVSITTLGLSTWQAMTSQPASISALVASASRTGSDQSPVMMSCTVAFGFTLLTPSVKALTLRSTSAIGLAAMKPILFDLGRQAGGDAVHVVRLVEIAEVAAEIASGACRPVHSEVGWRNSTLGILLGGVDHEGVEVAERGREKQRGAVEIDHRLHGLARRRSSPARSPPRRP